MKKLLLFSACVMLAFSSCSKKKDNSPSATNTITANVAGTDTKFNTTVTGVLASGQGAYDLAITGLTGTGTSAQSLSISIGSQNPIVKGTYTLNSSTSSDATSFPDLVYEANLSGSSSAEFATDFTGTNATTITITSITSTNVQGTFNGVLVGDGNTTKSITSGTFNATIKTVNQN
jgi:hypothetical protein